MPLVQSSFKTLLTATALITMSFAVPLAAAQDAAAVDAAEVDSPAANVETPALNVDVKTDVAAETPNADATIAAAPEAIEETDVAVVEAVEPAVDYSMMNTFMEKLSVNERGRPSIAYKVVRESALPALDEYEAVLAAVDTESLDENDRLAYWLNVQNFLVVKAISTDTKKTNLKSLRGTAKKPGKLWTKDRITLAGQSYSIADVEAKITSDFKDPNVIYGMYQGVKGGPCLSETAYEGATVRARLAELGARYVNSRGIVSPSKGVVTVTPVYDWHKAALFNGDDKAIMKHVKSHANTALRGRLNTGREIKFTKLNYVADNYIVPKDVRAAAPQRRQAPAPRPTQQPRPRGGGGGGFGS